MVPSLSHELQRAVFSFCPWRINEEDNEATDALVTLSSKLCPGLIRNMFIELDIVDVTRDSTLLRYVQTLKQVVERFDLDVRYVRFRALLFPTMFHMYYGEELRFGEGMLALLELQPTVFTFENMLFNDLPDSALREHKMTASIAEYMMDFVRDRSRSIGAFQVETLYFVRCQFKYPLAIYELNWWMQSSHMHFHDCEFDDLFDCFMYDAPFCGSMSIAISGITQPRKEKKNLFHVTKCRTVSANCRIETCTKCILRKDDHFPKREYHTKPQ